MELPRYLIKLLRPELAIQATKEVQIHLPQSTIAFDVDLVNSGMADYTQAITITSTFRDFVTDKKLRVTLNKWVTARSRQPVTFTYYDISRDTLQQLVDAQALVFLKGRIGLYADFEIKDTASGAVLDTQHLYFEVGDESVHF